jgi:hypothetical protein
LLCKRIIFRLGPAAHWMLTRHRSAERQFIRRL